MTLKEEQEANVFALELLMPTHMILEYVNKYKNRQKLSDKRCISELCKTFQVSEIVMKTRLVNLGILTSI